MTYSTEILVMTFSEISIQVIYQYFFQFFFNNKSNIAIAIFVLTFNEQKIYFQAFLLQTLYNSHVKGTFTTHAKCMHYLCRMQMRNVHRRQTSGCSGCRCTRCFFSLVVLNKSRILINKSQILNLHPLFSGPFGANGNMRRHIKTVHEGHKDFKCKSCIKPFT